MTRLLPGPAGLDSPTLDLELTTDDWRAWLDIGTARTTGRPAPVDALIHALSVDGEPAWRFWWDRQHTTGLLTHRADVLAHPAGETLLTACGYSTPWRGYGVGVAPVGDVPIRDARRTYCLHCTATVPDQQPAPGDLPPTNPGDLVIPRR